MQRETLGERATALDGIGDLIDRVLEENVAFLFREDIKPAEQGQTRINQGRELARKDPQCLRFDRPLLEKDGPFTFRSRGYPDRLRASARLFLRRDALSFFVEPGWAIAGLPKLDDGVTGRNGFDEAGRFLTARVERHISELGHGGILGIEESE